MSNVDTYFTIILALVIVVVGLGLGADSTFDDFRNAFKKPRAGKKKVVKLKNIHKTESGEYKDGANNQFYFFFLIIASYSV
jgi:hypothetical protein